MESSSCYPKLILLAFWLLTLSSLATTIFSSQESAPQLERKIHIVYLGSLPVEGRRILSTAEEQHHSLLAEAVGDEGLARQIKLHSYGRSFNAFAAHLLPHEVEKLSEMPGVISVFENRRLDYHTTRSWDFLGMPLHGTKRNLPTESNTIVGVIDTGIYMDAPSFKDDGFGPPPAKWKGKCVKGVNFTGCNNKVIGARVYNLLQYYGDENPTPADLEGHGTHTASTAAGGAVRGASYYGIAKGTARGGVPGARIAVYKVCGINGCFDVNILAAFDDAIADGVDVISISLGGDPINFFYDPIGIGSFHCMKKGILTVAAGGNSGPYEASVSNVAPWILTVAASNIDRQFRTPVKLGNGFEFSGLSINTLSPKKDQMYPLISGAQAANDSSMPWVNASYCEEDSLSAAKVKGKIVLCLELSGVGSIIQSMGGKGVIIALSDQMDIAFTTNFPSTFINSKLGLQILKYINSSKNKATGAIYKTITKKEKAPAIAYFSSRGPQFIARNILKPDIAAPGIDILAAYSKLAPVTSDPGDDRHAYFNVLSGTSMATPHVSGAAAYVKSFHPDWSPAAIQSALMTTAKPVIVDGIESPLNSGSGLLNPTGAVNPGLVYDVTLSSYVSYLCKEGYNSTTLSLLFGGDKPEVKCSDYPRARGADGLNYPAMHLQLFIDDTSYSATFHRTVTQVGYGSSTYNATVTVPKGMSVQVIPNQLVFSKRHEKRNFKVMIKGELKRSMPTTTILALLEWDDGKHNVRSPIVVYKPILD
ncbi:hypothetical protein Dimus_034737 [Dionaea muscipula]